MDTQFLIADDSQGKIDFLVSLIGKSGYRGDAIVAMTTDQAKELIDMNPAISYAFIDYEMPSETGIAIIEYLRKKNPHAKIALVTASNSDAYEEEAMNAGADAFVCTSFAADEVAEKISDLLLEWLPPQNHPHANQ